MCRMAVRRVTPTSAVSARLVDTRLAGHESAHTRSAYRTDLAMFGPWCAQHHSVPLAADTATLAAFGLARQAAGDSDATMRRRWSSLSSFFQYAVHTGNAASNPVDGVDRPGVKIALMVALTESTLQMLTNTGAYPESANYPNDGNGTDHDSLGLFQMLSLIHISEPTRPY